MNLRTGACFPIASAAGPRSATLMIGHQLFRIDRCKTEPVPVCHYHNATNTYTRRRGYFCHIGCRYFVIFRTRPDADKLVR